MATVLSRAESWELIHEAFTNVNFNAFDYNTIKQSLIDYLKIYYPENFNDFIESSEFVALLELFAYVGELIAYRNDLNAHENFLSTAERKESILRLAKIISYNANRNLPARGLVKITSIKTTEQVIDSRGINLANKTIYWNDQNNPFWKEQFILIMNRIMEQDFGTIAPTERKQYDDVLFEVYTLKNLPLSNTGISVFPYNATSNNVTFQMELVPAELGELSPQEKRPERNLKFSILYANDGLGDGSDTTGFMMFTKQGTLQIEEAEFDGVTPNQTYDINVDNINETDVWLNNVNPSTREILTKNPYEKILPHLVDDIGRYGEWFAVNTQNGDNILFNDDKNRQKYEIETLDNDQIRLVFGDGEFSDIPKGSFDIWYRISANTNEIIQKQSVIDQEAKFTYLDDNNTIQTFTFTFSLVSSLQNSSVSEDKEHIRKVAPLVNYTQHRMVNAKDYNTFMLQDPSILKLKAINRTFSGDSKYISWHDPKEYYDNVKIVGEDLALYWDDNDIDNGNYIFYNEKLDSRSVLKNVVEPLLCTVDMYNVYVEEFNKYVVSGGSLPIRCTFNDTETQNIIAAMDNAASYTVPYVDIYFSIGDGSDFIFTVGPNPDWPSVRIIRIESRFTYSSLTGWAIYYRTKKLVAYSKNTIFRSTNTTDKVISYNSLTSEQDSIVVLKANENGNGNGLLLSNKSFNVIGQEVVKNSLPNAGLVDNNRLAVLPSDLNNDGIPDDLVMEELMYYNMSYIIDINVGTTNISRAITFANPDAHYLFGDENDISVVFAGSVIPFDDPTSNVYWTYLDGSEIQHGIILVVQNNAYDLYGPQSELSVRVPRYVYFKRDTINDDWYAISGVDSEKLSYYYDTANLFKRAKGRYPLNFMWFYKTRRYHLVNPSPTNIHDMFVITAPYYVAMKRWLEGSSTIKPMEPSSFDLRMSYSYLLDKSMISDSVIMHSGKFKILFGNKAQPELQATFKVIKSKSAKMTDNEIKVAIVESIKNYFDINRWEFGKKFYFMDMSTYIMNDLYTEINSIVLVPTNQNNYFGDLIEIEAAEDEIFVADIDVSDIEIVDTYTPDNIKQI